MTKPISEHTHPKIIELTFSFPESPPTCKKSVLSIYSFLGCIVNFRVSYPKNFEQALIYVNLYQHAKYQASSLICFGNMVD